MLPELLACMYIACPQHGDLRLSGPPSGQGARAPVAGFELATEGSLQTSKRIRYALCHRRLQHAFREHLYTKRDETAQHGTKKKKKKKLSKLYFEENLLHIKIWSISCTLHPPL
ncbi:hypothetical protein PoB_005622200 [Plakobranchus ocellatus]|uniref:Uncharacterized protein n=1 Tax=Plakobranchus ocellatus TaxID=259542 RepID=A0AAV4CES0_9GAST|nr:hypothetical protein PoB_005622200 [Plakobranchus ocellatus]